MKKLTPREIEGLSKGMDTLWYDYPFINNGGCGYVAKWVGEAFIKKGYKVKYLVLDNVYTDLPEIRETFKEIGNRRPLRELNDNGIWVGHILTVVEDKYYIDSSGICLRFRQSSWKHLSQIGFATHDTICRWVVENRVWNELFMDNYHDKLGEMEDRTKKVINSLVV
jgi:hypothetical protein